MAVSVVAVLVAYCYMVQAVSAMDSYHLILLPSPNTTNKGAVCLDGSDPGYYLKKGSGEDAKKWIIYFPGGSWCFDLDHCVGRTGIFLGSSTFWAPTIERHGFLSSNCTENPNFCNWSVAYLGYCDGGSFTGTRSNPVAHNGKTLYFQGFRILKVILRHLLTVQRIDQADYVLVSGASAGGLGVFLHLEYIRKRLPRHLRSRVRGVADDGFAIDIPAVNGTYILRKRMKSVFTMQKAGRGVNRDCIAANKRQKWKCMFAENTYPFIQTPLFVLNHIYDVWQIATTLYIECLPPTDCGVAVVNNRTVNLTEEVYKFGERLLKALQPVRESLSDGLFATACMEHGYLGHSSGNVANYQSRVGNYSVGDAIHKWITENKRRNEKTQVKKIDECYLGSANCHSTCPSKLPNHLFALYRWTRIFR